jgi:hypothetical protein
MHVLSIIDHNLGMTLALLLAPTRKRVRPAPGGCTLGDGSEPIMRSPRGSRVIPNRQRLAAVGVRGEREAHLPAVQRLVLVDAAAWWLSEPNGGEELAYVLLAASCSAKAHNGTGLSCPDHVPRRTGGSG